MPESDQGINDLRYQVVPRTLIFLFNQRNQVLLLRGANSKRLWSGLYNGIGGHIEAGEDIVQAAYRELSEETGIHNVILRFCAQVMVDVAENTGVAIFIFRGDASTTDFTPSKEGRLFWVDLDDLESIPLVEDLPLLIPRIAANQSESPVIIGKYVYQPDGSMKVSFR